MSIINCCIFTIFLFFTCQAAENFKAYFPLSYKNSYPRLLVGTLPILNEFTFCSWLRPLRLDVEYPYIFSYATSRENNELTVLLQNSKGSILGYVQLRKPFVSFNCSFSAWKIGSWKHVCASWLGADGSTKFFVNGQQCSAIENPYISPGGYVLDGGVAMLGQDQDEVGGSFEINQAWYGDIANVNLWKETLNDNQIWEAAQCNGKRKEGTVISWLKTGVKAFDGVVITDTELCEL